MSPETVGTVAGFGSSDPALLETFESLVRRLTPELLAALHKAALDYLDLVPPVATLAAPVGRRDYLKQLVHGINFETM